MTEFVPLSIPGVIEIRAPRFGDHRGFFSEVYAQHVFAAAGINNDWVQDNQSYSAAVGTVRGAHFQLPPHAQAKLVRVVRGAIWDVAIDIRRGSPTFGRWVGLEISAEKWNQLLVPAGFAHCFMTIQPDTEVLYKVDAAWSREHERSLMWNDPDLAIDWPDVGVAPTLSGKDADAPRLADFDTPFVYQG